MQVLRTPESRFANIPDFDYETQFIDFDELRMAYIEFGEGDPILCLHGEPSWGFLYRKMIPDLSKVGRVICPDFIGFGRSDKPKQKIDYSFEFHYRSLQHFVETLNLKKITLVCQDWGGLLGLPYAMKNQERFSRLVIMNTGLPTGEKQLGPGFMRWREMAKAMTDMPVGGLIQMATTNELPAEVVAAYDAPFPDASYKAGAHQFPLLVPIQRDDPIAQIMSYTEEELSKWRKAALILFSDSDPVTKGGDVFFRNLIPSAMNEPEIIIENAGHFLQEDKGEEIARHIVDFIKRRPTTSS